MNTTLLVIVTITEFIALLCDLRLAYVIHSMNVKKHENTFGGLRGTWWKIWCSTYIISSVGITISFFWHLLYASDTHDVPIVLIFAVMNISHIFFDVALIQADKTVVLPTIVTLAMSYTALTVYTIYVFPWLLPVHICNVVGVLHAVLLDGFVWYRQWASTSTPDYTRVNAVENPI
jgi:hypothetical protein